MKKVTISLADFWADTELCSNKCDEKNEKLCYPTTLPSGKTEWWCKECILKARQSTGILEVEVDL